MRRHIREKAREGEVGSGTASYAVVVSALLVLGFLFVAVTVFMTTKQRVQAVADLSALAGGDLSAVGVFAPGTDSGACSIARQVAGENQMTLSSCRVAGADTYVSVSTNYTVGPFRYAVVGRARAGPLLPVG